MWYLKIISLLCIIKSVKAFEQLEPSNTWWKMMQETVTCDQFCFIANLSDNNPAHKEQLMKR